MNRMFTHKVSVGEVCGVIIFAALSLYFLWGRTGYSVYIGLFCMFMTFVSIERIIHTTYCITPDGWLVCSYGRFGGVKRLRLTDIISIRRVPTAFRLSHFILITYAAHRMLAVSPSDEEGFVREIKKRL